jgi:hypothetical protein
MKSVRRQLGANVSMHLGSGEPETQRKVRKLAKSSRLTVGCGAKRMAPCPIPVQAASEGMKSGDSMRSSGVSVDANPKSQDIAKDANTTAKEERLQALRSKLWSEDPLFQHAGQAYVRLARRGCNMRLAMGYVSRAAGYNRGNFGRRGFRRLTGSQISRELRAITRGLKKLANRTAELRRIWGFGERMVDAHAFHAPEALANITARLSCISTEHFGDWFPQREAVLGLLELVRRTIGRPHYVEVSSLINAELVWRAEKNGGAIPDRAFDPENLKMIVKREKERQAAVAEKRSKTKERVTSLSVAYSPRQTSGLDPIN